MLRGGGESFRRFVVFVVVANVDVLNVFVVDGFVVVDDGVAVVALVLL